VCQTCPTFLALHTEEVLPIQVVIIRDQGEKAISSLKALKILELHIPFTSVFTLPLIQLSFDPLFALIDRTNNLLAEKSEKSK